MTRTWTPRSAWRNCVFLGLLLSVPQGKAAPQETWIATWAASPQPMDAGPREPLLHIEDQTVRERVRISAGGAKIRIRLSNEYGTSPLQIGSVTVAVPTDPASVKPESIHTVTFARRNSVTVAPGLRTTTAPGSSPSVLCGMPTMAASITSGWSYSTFSTSTQ